MCSCSSGVAGVAVADEVQWQGDPSAEGRERDNVYGLFSEEFGEIRETGLSWQRGTLRPIRGEVEEESLLIIDDPVKYPLDEWRDPQTFRALVRGRSWGLADAPLWAKIIGYSFVAVLAIVGGLALGMLILFLVACIQALLDIVTR